WSADVCSSDLGWEKRQKETSEGLSRQFALIKFDGVDVLLPLCPPFLQPLRSFFRSLCLSLSISISHLSLLFSSSLTLSISSSYLADNHTTPLSLSPSPSLSLSLS